MYEKEFIFHTFQSYLSSEPAIEDFKNFSRFTKSEHLQDDIRFSLEIQKFCRESNTLYFQELRDIRLLLPMTLKDYVLSCEDIFCIYQYLIQWQHIISEQIISQEYPLFYDMIHNIYFPQELSSVWKHCFENDGSIADSASPELRRIRGLKKSLRQRIEKILHSQVAKNEDLAEKRIAFREGRYVLPIKPNAKNRMDGIIHGFSATGATAYIEPKEIVSLNNELLSVDDLETQELNRLLRHWSKLISEYTDDIECIISASAMLEIHFAKAVFAKQYDAVFPTISDTNEIHLDTIYNPYLIIKKGKKNVTPIHLDLESHNQGFIISGPNAGGKSAALKTLALACEMMIKGLPIPMKEGILPFFENIFIEIGDSQNLEDELSTFSGHLSALKNILEHASTNTLVLIDEIAHATDPIEGEALGCAIIDDLIRKNTIFGITTHYRQVKNKAFEHQNIKIYAAGFNQETLSPYYTLIPDTIGESYALKIASRVGLSSQLINEAEAILNQKKDKTDTILANVESFEKKLREKEYELSQLEFTLKEKQIQLLTRESQLLEQIEKLQKEGLAFADKELNNALRELSGIYKTIKQSPKTASAKLKEQKHIVNSKKTDIHKKNYKPATSLNIGDHIFVASLNKKAVIEEIGTDSVFIRAGILRIPVKKSDLFEIDQPSPIVAKKHITRTAIEVVPSIDVHGLRGDEAISKLEKYLYPAMASGLNEFVIIHGKGTGILQRLIHDYLKNVPEVKNYHFAHPKDGGSGKTIVIFK